MRCNDPVNPVAAGRPGYITYIQKHLTAQGAHEYIVKTRQGTQVFIRHGSYRYNHT